MKRRHTVWLVIQLVLAVGLMLVFAILTVAGVLLGTRSEPGTSLAASITIASIGVVLGGLCIWWAIHAEHRLRGRASTKHVAEWERRVDAEFALTSRYGFEQITSDSSFWEASVIYGKGTAGLKIARSTEERCVDVQLIRLVDGAVPPYPMWITGDRIDWIGAAAVLKARNSPLLAELPPGGLSDREVATQLRFWAQALPEVAPDFLAGDPRCIDEAAAVIRQSVRPGTQTLTVSLPETASDNDVAAARHQASNGLPPEVRLVTRSYRARRKRLPSKYVPVVTAFAFMVLVGVVVGVWGATISAHGAVSRSIWVQHHGVPETGTVTHVQNEQYGRSHTGGYRARIDVVLVDPGAKSTTTVAHYPHRSKLRAGDTVRVLIDPRDPGYAELPGAQFATASRWVFPLILAVIATLGVVVMGFAVVRQFQHRRAPRGAPPATVR